MYKGTFRDITGQKFHRLTAVRRVTTSGRSKWLCQCECGNQTIVSISNLKNGAVRSCGCLNADKNRELREKHGDDRKNKTARLYRVWKSMRQRCYLKSCRGYKWYGARGITVCPEWEDYQAFKEWAIENGYDETAKRGDCTIDRIDVDGNYEPSNCRWVDMKTQAKNKRR